MPLDYGMIRQFGQQPTLLQDVYSNLGQQNRLAQLSQERELGGMRIQQAQQQMERAPVLQEREDIAYQAAQQEALRKGEEARQFNEMIGKLPPQQQLAARLAPKEWIASQFAKPKEPTFIPELGGYVQPPTAEKPSGAFTQVPGISKKEKEVNWQVAQTDQGVVQVNPVTGKVRPLGIQQPKKASQAALSATAQKELFEAEDVAQSSKNVMSLLDEAKKLNDKAYSGVGAKARAVIRSNIPGESEAANATIALDNLMTGQALESLKATFGGMPTEGERKILLDIQASAEKTPKQRADIMERAKRAAENRLRFSTEKAKKLRSGEYFSPEAQVEAPAINIDSLLDKYK